MEKNSSILITGGTGSFGNTFVPMTLEKYDPKRLVIYSRDEMKQWEMAKSYEDDPRGDDENVYFVGEGNDAWSLAKKFTETGATYPNLLIWSGTEDPNYPSIEIYMNYLDKLDIKYDSLIVKGVDHNPFIFYEQSGGELIRFHANND